jgi:hypothetical protein
MAAGSCTTREWNEWAYARDGPTDVTKYRVYTVTWSLPAFLGRLNSLRPGARCWQTVVLGDQRVSLTVERCVHYRQPRPRTNLPVEYDDWLELGLRNVGDEILWLAGVEVGLAAPHQALRQECGAVDLHRNERVAELARFVRVERLRVLLAQSSALNTVWRIRVESGGQRPAAGHLAEDRPELASQFWALFQQSLLTDYTLVCGGEEVRVHRAVLAARSEYWRALLTTDMKEAAGATAEVNAVSKDTLHLLLEFVYTGRVQTRLEPGQMERLLEAADFYGVSSLKEQCEEGLILSLEPANLVDRLVLGDTFSAAQLRQVSCWPRPARAALHTAAGGETDAGAEHRYARPDPRLEAEAGGPGVPGAGGGWPEYGKYGAFR